jgi:hypothetical protein
MKADRNAYRKLTGRRRKISGYSQLWLGPDHLLMVKSTRFSERYQRFSLADIQAIVVSEVPTEIIFRLIALTGAILGVGGFLFRTSWLDRIPLAMVAVVSIAVLIVHIASGPRCRCYLQTVIGRELLAPVVHVRTARAVLARIRPLIEAAQGTLTPERAAAVDVAPDPVAKPPEVAHAPGYLPEVLCGVFLLNAALILASVRFPKAQIANVLFTTLFGEFVMIVVALLRRSGRDARRVIYAVIAVALIGVGWDFIHITGNVMGWFNGVVESARRGDPGPPPSILNLNLFSQSNALYAGMWRIVAGVIGFIAAWFER